MKHFSFKELCHSDKANQLGIKNDPTAVVCDNLHNLTQKILDPAREALGRSIYVNSGYRCPSLNKAIGGVATSQHCHGEAVDIELGGKSAKENKELYDWILANCEFDQLINEYDFSWVHVSLKLNGRNRNKTLKIG